MIEVLDHIKNLPNVSDESITLINKIFNNLPNKTLDDFKQQLYLNSNGKIYKEATTYVTALFQLNDALKKFKDRMSEIWDDNTLETPLNIDHMIPLLIDLLPGNLETLLQLKKQVMLAMRLSIDPVCDYLLTSFCGAFEVKINSYDKKDHGSFPDEGISHVAKLLVSDDPNEKKILAELESILPLFNDYRQYLLESYEEKCKTKDKLAHDYYYRNRPARSTINIMQEILEDYYAEQSLAPKDAELKNHLDKYLVMYDILYTLNHSRKPPSHKKEVLIAKCIQHKDIFLSQKDTETSLFLTELSYKLQLSSYLPWGVSLEASLVKTFGFFSPRKALSYIPMPAILNLSKSP